MPDTPDTPSALSIASRAIQDSAEVTRGVLARRQADAPLPTANALDLVVLIRDLAAVAGDLAARVERLES